MCSGAGFKNDIAQSPTKSPYVYGIARIASPHTSAHHPKTQCHCNDPGFAPFSCLPSLSPSPHPPLPLHGRPVPQRFCKDVEPGAMRVQECLEGNMDDADCSVDCKEELDAVLAKRVANFALDTALREACEGDLKELCSVTLEAMDGEVWEELQALGIVE